MGWVLLRKRGKMFLNINNFTLAFYTAGMFFLGMLNFFQAKMSSKRSLRSWLSTIQGIGYGVVVFYFLVVIFQSQELTPAFKLWVGLLFMVLFQVEVIEATLLFSNPEKFLSRESHIKEPSSSERFRFLKKIFSNQGPLLHYLNVVLSLVISLGALGIHLLIITGFLFI